MTQLRIMFPEVKHHFTKVSQLERVADELQEAKEVIDCTHAFLYEVVDILHAAANVLYKTGYTNIEIDAAINAVQIKNKLRGYYNGNNQSK